MAMLMILDVQGATTEQYDRTNELAGIDANPREGLLSHVCGVDGRGVAVADVWQSQAAFEEFARAAV